MPVAAITDRGTSAVIAVTVMGVVVTAVVIGGMLRVLHANPAGVGGREVSVITHVVGTGMFGTDAVALLVPANERIAGKVPEEPQSA